MKKKILVLFICLFLFSGCQINYDLKISKEGCTETTKIVENDLSMFNSSELEKQFYNSYSMLPIPLNYYIPIPTNITTNENGNLNDKEYYISNNITNINQVGMQYTGNFSFSNLVDSRFIKEAAPNLALTQNGGVIKITSGSLAREFKQLPMLDEMNINVLVDDYSVVDHNADKVSGNTYTWNITKDNYQKKTIKLEITNLSKITYASKEMINKIPNKEIVLISLTLIIIAGIIYLYLKRKQKQKNKF